MGLTSAPGLYLLIANFGQHQHRNPHYMPLVHSSLYIISDAALVYLDINDTKANHKTTLFYMT